MAGSTWVKANGFSRSALAEAMMMAERPSCTCVKQRIFLGLSNCNSQSPQGWLFLPFSFKVLLT